MRDSASIRESPVESELIIEHALDILDQNGKIDVSKPIGRVVVIADVSPELKKMRK